jgi:hypothetical protein
MRGRGSYMQGLEALIGKGRKEEMQDMTVHKQTNKDTYENR